MSSYIISISLIALAIFILLYGNHIHKDDNIEYDEFPIKGMKHNNIKDSDIGKFDGYAIVDKEGKYGINAVVVFHTNGKQLGYIIDSFLHNMMIERDKKIPLVGEIKRTGEGYFWGNVYIENFKNFKI